jgi:asparagine synthase (glutamine-hydrolysing)
MSAIAAVVRWDAGPPVEPAEVGQMTPAGPVGLAGVWVDGAVAVAEFHPGAMEVPLAGPDGVVLAWDGRLDNRAELLARFGGTSPRGRPPSDAALVLAAYRAVGTAFLDLLVGDFGLVVWDGRVRRLLAARDQLGVRPLHYAVDGGWCRIASHISQLRTVPPLGARVNERTLGQFLAGTPSDPGETFFDGINRVPAGHVLEVDDRGPRVRRYWSPDWDRLAQYDTDGEYVEHFHTVFRDAVESRLRSVRPVGLLLSGGLDSTAIAWATGESNREKALLRHPFSTFMTTSRDLESPADRRRASVVRDRYGFVAHQVPADAAWTFTDPPTDPAGCDEPLEGMYAGTVRSLLDCARTSGVGALLTGYGGDLLLAGNHYYLLDLLLTRQWSTLLAELRCAAAGQRTRLVRRYLARPLLFGRPAGPPRLHVPEWVTPDLAAGMYPESDTVNGTIRGRRSISRMVEMRAVSLDQQATRLLWYHGEGVRRGIELRHAFLDRRLVEFLLSVPVVRKIRQGRAKAILRETVPHELMSVDATSGGPTESAEARRVYRSAIRERERSQWTECFAEARSIALGYVNPAALDTAFGHYYRGRESLRYALARTFRAELWLKRSFTEVSTPRR